MWPDHLNDRSVPDRPFRIQDWIGGRSNELILLSSVRTGELIPKLMSIWRHLSHSASTLGKEDNSCLLQIHSRYLKREFYVSVLLVIVLNRFGWWVRSQRICDTYQTIIERCPDYLQHLQKRLSHQTVLFTRGSGIQTSRIICKNDICTKVQEGRPIWMLFPPVRCFCLLILQMYWLVFWFYTQCKISLYIMCFVIRQCCRKFTQHLFSLYFKAIVPAVQRYDNSRW